jgi:hypothetical protein
MNYHFCYVEGMQADEGGASAGGTVDVAGLEGGISVKSAVLHGKKGGAGVILLFKFVCTVYILTNAQ